MQAHRIEPYQTELRIKLLFLLSYWMKKDVEKHVNGARRGIEWHHKTLKYHYF